MNPTTAYTHVRKTGPPDRPWVLIWQTERMPAPAFWYYATQDEANKEAEKLRNRWKPANGASDPLIPATPTRGSSRTSAVRSAKTKPIASQTST